MTWRHWLHGFIGAVVGGGANAVTVSIIDPQKFNLQEGWQNLLMAVLVSGILSGALYLKQSPVPTEPTAPPSDQK